MNTLQTRHSECEYFMDMILLHVAVINARFSLAHTAIKHSLKGLYRNFKGVWEINTNCVLGYGSDTQNNTSCFTVWVD
jgi:hypothetical protein